VVGAGVGGSPHVKVYDGVSGKIVHDFQAFGSSMKAGVRVATAFVSDDKYADIVVATGQGPTATVKVFDGLTGTELASPMSPYTPFGANFTGGLYVAASNDPPSAQVPLVCYSIDGEFGFTCPTKFDTPYPSTCPPGAVDGASGAGNNRRPLKKPNNIRADGGIGIQAYGGVGGQSSTGSTAMAGGSIGWSNSSGYQNPLVKAGSGMSVHSSPWLSESAGGVTMIDGPMAGLPFKDNGAGGFNTMYGHPAKMVLDGTAQRYKITDGAGAVVEFYDFLMAPTGRAGQWTKTTDAAGNISQVMSWDTSGRPSEVQTTDGASGAVESVLTAYNTDGTISTITRQRKPSGGAFSVVRTSEFNYGTVSGLTDTVLQGVVEKNAGGAILTETYNRWYDNTATTGYAGAMKYNFGAEATARLKQAFSGTPLANLTDAQVAPYADNYFEYDAKMRVTKEVTAGSGCSACTGGQGTVTVTYAGNPAPGTGVNDSFSQITTTQDDGTVTTVYVNRAAQPLLEVTTEAGTGKVWRSYTRYGADGQVILQAEPSAVTGHDENLPDLVGYSGANATYLNDSAGLITTYTYGTTTSGGDVAGYLKGVAIKKGENGTAIPQSAMTYIGRTAGTETRYHVASSTQYRDINAGGAQTTNYAYTWQGATHQIAKVTTTLPIVTTAQNGPNIAASSETVLDQEGRPTWSKDALGILSYTAYDPQTGAVVKSISDVNHLLTTTFANLPSGWITPAGIGAGKHLTSTYEVDNLGRTTKATNPLGNITYTVYNDVTKEVRTYAGWTGTAATGPTYVSRNDWSNNYSETLTMSAAPTVVGGKPTGTEAISGIQSLSRTYRNAAGQAVTSDSYFNLTGVTYSTAINLGTQNTNFYRTQQVYDKQGRPNKSVSAAGTITRTERDAMGRPVSTWIGTDDSPTTGFWSVTNLPGTNMVKVQEVEYDNGGTGNGNATKVTQFPGSGAANRVTRTLYDWRDRPVLTKSGSEVPASESASVNRPISYTEYDNLGESIVSEMYDGDAVNLDSTANFDANTDGIPDRPLASTLRAKTATSYDELNRAYKTQTYAVDPANGTPSTFALTSQVWFDLRGLTLKSTAPGGMVQKTAYDSLGRATTQYVSDGGGDTTWADAANVTGDIVLSQSEATYDANSNVILNVSRERFHSASATGYGVLGTSTTGVLARVSYSATYFDVLDRMTDRVNVGTNGGTNGGTAYTRPGAVPTRSDTVLVSSVQYDSAGRRWKSIDPKGLESRTIYDLMGRTTKTIENYVDGTVSNLDDKTTEYAYGPAGMTSLTAKTTASAGQTTEYVYGVTTAGGHGINSNDVVGKTRWPDPSTGASSTGQQETVLVNALGQPLVTTDRNGNTHTLSYDILGRVVSDTVTTLGVGVDGTVRRTETAYDTQGNPYLLTSYDAVTGGAIVNQVQRVYNGLGQMTREYQSHSGAVVVATPKVQYAYSALDANNRSRLTNMTYPNGRIITYNYATGIDNTISRLSSISDGAVTLESYQYLGTSTVVERNHAQPNVNLSYVKLSTESNGDGGDQYTGLDRFGRIRDQRWRVGTTTTDRDRNTYTYDRNGNRLTETNTLNAALNEVHTYDGLNQLSSFNRNVGARTQNFGYDASGNWNTVSTNGVTQTRTANMQNEYTSVSGATTPTYDPNGNMSTDETGKQYVYDAWNRLKVVKSAANVVLATYQYDARNYRVAEAVGANTRSLYYSSNWQLLEERVNGTARVSNVWSPVYVDAMVCRDRDSDNNGSLEERLYPTHDANFNVTALVNASGVVVEKYAYDPYGVVTIYNASNVVLGSSAYGWQHFHQGGRLDATSGLYHFRNREYSATLGRWVSMDPIRYDAGDANLYGYVRVNPIAKLDPAGLQWYSPPGPGYNSICPPCVKHPSVSKLPNSWNKGVGKWYKNKSNRSRGKTLEN
jgi:RHS repeat-associated protein